MTVDPEVLDPVLDLVVAVDWAVLAVLAGEDLEEVFLQHFDPGSGLVAALAPGLELDPVPDRRHGYRASVYGGYCCCSLEGEADWNYSVNQSQGTPEKNAK